MQVSRSRHFGELVPPGNYVPCVEIRLLGNGSGCREVTGAMTQDIADRNKGNVVAFYDLMFNRNQPREAIERYAGKEYRQHNTHVGDGKQAFIDYFDQMAADYPHKRVEFKRVLTDGEFVVLHCHQIWPDEEYAGIDIFRLDENGRIVEHWDVLQVIPVQSANDNGMF